MATFVNILISGLATGAIYALIAIGFTLLWQTSQTINFAQGEFVMLPAILILAATMAGLPLWLAVIAAGALFVLVFGIGFKRLVVDPMIRQGVLPLAISTGAGASSRHAIGTGVMGGMIAATALAVFLVPVFFLVVQRFFPSHPRRHADETDDDAEEKSHA